jgi:putative transposase
MGSDSIDLNFALTNERFADQVGAMIGRRMVPGVSGRPRKVAKPESGDLF